MRRAFRGLHLYTRRVIADTHTHHHHSNDQSHIPITYEEAVSCFQHQHHHHYRHLHGMSSALGSISHGFQWTRSCKSSTHAASSPVALCVVAHASSAHPAPAVDRYVGTPLSSTFQQPPTQHRNIHDAKVAENFSHVMTPPNLSTQETHKLLKLIKVDDFKKRLLSTGKHCMPLEEVLKICKQTGTATSDTEAEEVAKSLDEAGFILIFRKKVFLEPEKVAEVLSRAMPLPLAVEDDPRNQEYEHLRKEKEEIDRIAHKQVRKMLWGAFGALSAQSVLFFRLTFWELSWDVMEPIAFFVTSSSLLAGFFFFVITKRDPSYHDFMDTLFKSKQRKLIKKKNFDIERFNELQVMCCLPSSRNSPMHSHAQ
eukprot:c14748_g1_i1 orf=279-1382(-)